MLWVSQPRDVEPVPQTRRLVTMTRQRTWTDHGEARGKPPTAEQGRGTVVVKITKSDDYTPRFSLVPGFEYEDGGFVLAKFIPSSTRSKTRSTRFAPSRQTLAHRWHWS